MKRVIIICFSFAIAICLESCEKQYNCVCTKISSNEKELEESVKTTKLGKKGFEESCNNKNSEKNDLKDCHIE